MKVFVTGATGFIGTELVKNLIAADHQVRGLSRSEAGLSTLKAAGAEPIHGTIEDLDLLRTSATGMDAVVNLAFNHDDWSKFAESAGREVAAIEALGSALAPGALLVVTSGIGITAGAPGHIRVETDQPVESPQVPRRPEQAVRKVAAEKGLRAAIVRLPQVHDTRKQGLITPLIELARAKGLSAYIGEGTNRWAAGPLADTAKLYQLAVEKTGEGVHVYNAVEEEGVALKDIAEAIGKGLNIPVKSLSPEEAGAHFGMFAHFVSMDMPANSDLTQKALDWHPHGPTLLEDLHNIKY